MIGYLKAFGVFLIWAAIALTSHYFITNTIFNTCNRNTSENIDIHTPELVDTSLYILDNLNDTLMRFDKGVKIFKNHRSIEAQDQLIKYLTSLLQEDYTNKLIVFGKYSAEETPTLSGSIGLDRASRFQDQLMAQGVREIQLSKRQIISNSIFTTDSINGNGISLQLTKLGSTEIADIESLIKVKRFYLDFKDEVLNPTQELKQYLPNLKNYLQQYTEEKVYITGHTANAGYYQKNLEIGLDRANKVKDFFVKDGISADRIIAQSSGESVPIATKGSDEGRKLNKRIEILIK